MSILKKLLLTSAILNICWTFIGSLINRFLPRDYGVIAVGIGFLVVYSLTFFLYFETNKKRLHNLLILTFTIIAIFLIASLLPRFLFVDSSTDLRVIGFLICTWAIAFSGIVAIVGHYTNINHRISTIIIGSLVTALISYGVLKYVPEHIDTGKWNNIVNPLALKFCIWQVLTTYLIGRSIATRTTLQATEYLRK